MSFQPEAQVQPKTTQPAPAVAAAAPRATAAPAAAPRPQPPGSFASQALTSLSHLGVLGDVAKGAVNSLSGWGMNVASHMHGGANKAQAQAQAPVSQAGVVATAAKHSKGAAAQVAPALDAAARGESVAEQAARVKGPVKMSAARALRIGSEMVGSGDPEARSAIQNANKEKDGYQSPFVSVGLSGIRSDQGDAEGIAEKIAGDKTPHGYAAYGTNDKKYDSEKELGAGNGIDSPDKKSPTGTGADMLDTVNDVAAVTQYAAAAELGITLKPKKDGGKQVQIDWEGLSQMEVSADLGAIGLGGKIKYDNPTKVADNGYKAVMAEIESRDGKTGDKEQFISLTGHSGGGQSSFYTALKLASEGYKNVSLVGVDMAMTPHQREVLEALGVNVTNITSNNKDGKGGKSTSEIGDVIRTGMGGGQNYYDLNVERQKDADPLKRHDITNDANVATTVRFAQYLDATDQHGKFTPELYAQFLKDTGDQGDKTSAGDADRDLLSKVTDQRRLPGADANSTDLGAGASTIENIVNLLGGKPVEDAIKDKGQQINNGFDKAGDKAKGWFDWMPKAGSWLGGMANKGLDALGGAASSVGSFLGNGLEKAGGLAQSVMGAASSGVSWLGGMANKGLDAIGGGISSVGSTVSNGLDKAGDAAQSWLGNVPLVGGLLGGAANKGLDMLGGGVSAVTNLVGGGLDKAGDVLESGSSLLGKAGNFLGGGISKGLGWLGGKTKSLTSMIGGAIDKAGDIAEAGLTKGSSALGGFLGNAANSILDGIGNGIGWAFDKTGDLAGDAIRALTGGGVRKLQEVGFDTGQIKGLSDFDSTNPSVTRGWKDKLTEDKTDESKVKTIDIPAGDLPKQLPPSYAQEFKQDVGPRLDATKDLKPEQRDLVKSHLASVGEDKLAPPEMVAVDRALKGPNADRAMAAYSDLIKMTAADPKAKERLTPEVMAMLVSGVGDRRTESDRGQAGILGARQTRDAAQGLLNMSGEDYEKLMGVLSKAGKDQDGNPIEGADPRAEQALLLKAVAARRDDVKEESVIDKAKGLFGMESKRDIAMKDLDQFASDIRGTKREDLIRTTTLMDIDDENTSTVNPKDLTANNDTKSDNDGLYQRYNDSCAPTTQQILRGEMDPVYALKRHKQGLDNPDPDTEVAREQGATLDKHGGDSTLRQGDHANTALNGQIATAGLSTAQAQSIRDLTSGAKLDPAQAKDSQAALQALRAKNGGHPTDGEIKAMQANAANPTSSHTGVWQGDAAKELTDDVTHLQMREQNLGGSGIAPHLGNVEALLKDGQPVPFNLAWDGGGVHAMMMTDTRTDAAGNKTYLISDPWTGATRWVGQTELTNGTWSQSKFEGGTSTFQDLVADPSQTL